jgi:hypothetical protein
MRRHNLDYKFGDCCVTEVLTINILQRYQSQEMALPSLIRRPAVGKVFEFIH